MALYVGLLFYYIFGMLFEKIIGRKMNNKFWILILTIPLFIIVAFRSQFVGNDTLNYYGSFTTVSQESFFSETVSRLEIGYVYCIRTISLLGFDYLGFQIITTAFVYFSLARFIYKYSSNYAMSMFCFVTLNMFAQTMNISRQYIAIAILTYSISFILEKKPIKFSIVVFIATLFHTTSLIFLIIYYLVNVKLTKMKKLIIIIVGISISIGFDFVIGILSKFFGVYEGYLSGEYFETEGKIAVYFLLMIYFSFFLLGTAVGYGKDRNKNNDGTATICVTNQRRINKERLYYVAILITLVLGIIGLNTSIMSRLVSYFFIFFLVYIPDVLKVIKEKNIRFIVTNAIVVGLFLYYMIIMIFRPQWTGVIPYTWYF